MLTATPDRPASERVIERIMAPRRSTPIAGRCSAACAIETSAKRPSAQRTNGNAIEPTTSGDRTRRGAWLSFRSLSKRHAAAEQAAATALPPLSDSMTLAELRALIRNVSPNALTGTPEQLANAIRLLPGEPRRKQAAAQAARDAVRFCRQDCEGVLFQTSGRAPANPEADRLRYAIRDIEQRILARQPIIDAERLVARTRERIADISAGRVSITQVSEWSRSHWAGAEHPGANRQRRSPAIDGG